MSTTKNSIFSANSDYLVGLGDLLMNGETIGLVEKGSFKLNPKDAQHITINAEQVLTGPVFAMLTDQGSIEPTFNLIKIDYVTLQKVKGGTLVRQTPNDETSKPIGWLPPKGLSSIVASFAIKFYTGRYLPIPCAMLMASFGDNVTLTEATKLKCKLVPFADGDTDLYAIQDAAPTAENPIIKVTQGSDTQSSAPAQDDSNDDTDNQTV